MDVATLLAERPDVAPIDDPRVAFYLDHQSQIETWAALREEAGRAIWERILDLDEVLNQDLQLLGETDGVISAAGLDSRYPRLQVTRKAWSEAPDEPPVVFMIEAHSTLLDSKGHFKPYAGMRFPDLASVPDERKDLLWKLGSDLQQSLVRSWRGQRDAFPFWRWIGPDTDPVDVADLCAQARTSLWTAWAAGADRVTAVLAST